MPQLAITNPPMAGPTSRALLNWAEVSPTALTTCSRPTSSVTNDCRAGLSNAFVSPSTTAST